MKYLGVMVSEFPMFSSDLGNVRKKSGEETTYLAERKPLYGGKWC